jgi:hypothetical protein
LQGNDLGHDWRQYTEGILNLSIVLRDRLRGSKVSLEGRRFKSRGIIRVSDFWGVESTKESKDSMEESKNHQEGSLGLSTGCSLRLGEHEDEGVRVTLG